MSWIFFVKFLLRELGVARPPLAVLPRAAPGYHPSSGPKVKHRFWDRLGDKKGQSSTGKGGKQGLCQDMCIPKVSPCTPREGQAWLIASSVSGTVGRTF